MSKFHATVSRRNFMKGLGLAGAGLGAAAAASPMFHDLDELASTGTHPGKPWWIKEREFNDLTTEIDWNIWKPRDRSANPMPAFNTPELLAARRALYDSDCRSNTNPASKMKDYALSFGARGCTPDLPWDGPLLTRSAVGGIWPSTFDLPRWSGNAEDNMSMVRAALHYYGSPDVGCTEIDTKTFTLFNKDSLGYETGLEKGYKDGSKAKVPSECKYLLTYVTKQNGIQNAYARAEDEDDTFISNRPLGGASSADAYSHGPQTHYKLMRFIKALGYHAYTPTISGNCAAGVFSGLVEQGRAGFSMHPKYGLMIRYIRFILTDLPLSPTKPIDYGGVEFCKTCKVCAEACPSGSVSLEDDQTWEVRDAGNNPGIKAFYQGWSKCAVDQGGPWDCLQCQSNCPFNSLPNAGIHGIVRGTIANTSLFNGFFANMETVMGFDRRPDDDAWWSRDLNTWEHDTLYGFGTSGW
jgi:epoxyqueuosine reductase